MQFKRRITINPRPSRSRRGDAGSQQENERSPRYIGLLYFCVRRSHDDNQEGESIARDVTRSVSRKRKTKIACIHMSSLAYMVSRSQPLEPSPSLLVG